MAQHCSRSFPEPVHNVFTWLCTSLELNPELCISLINPACHRGLDILIALPQSYHQYFELCFRFFHLVSEKSYWDIKLRWTCLRAQSQNTNQGAVPLPNDTMNHVSRNLFYQNFLFGKEQENFFSQHTISLRWNLSRVSSKVDSYRVIHSKW